MARGLEPSIPNYVTVSSWLALLSTVGEWGIWGSNPGPTHYVGFHNISVTMWARQGLNLRPDDYESPALTTELLAQGDVMNCIICNTELIGKQTKFCSNSCKFKEQNRKNQNYAKQQERGWTKKKAAVLRKGGQCVDCGYNRNLSVLSFHHLRDKEIALDMRAFSNLRDSVLEQELTKCVLLCMNCHGERHHPTLAPL
jgi:hypothetical protein